MLENKIIYEDFTLFIPSSVNVTSFELIDSNLDKTIIEINGERFEIHSLEDEETYIEVKDKEYSNYFDINNEVVRYYYLIEYFNSLINSNFRNEQKIIQHEIQSKGYNIICCNKCDAVLLVRSQPMEEKENPVGCDGCGNLIYPNDCSDLNY